MTEVPSLTLILGLPGAGKSTFLKSLEPPAPGDRHRLTISMDYLRLAYGYTYNDATEAAVFQCAHAMIRSALSMDHDVVVDEAFTKYDPVETLAITAWAEGAKVHMVLIDTPALTCWHRREKEGFPVDSFLRKAFEWERDRDAILGLADHLQIYPQAEQEATCVER